MSDYKINPGNKSMRLRLRAAMNILMGRPTAYRLRFEKRTLIATPETVVYECVWDNASHEHNCCMIARNVFSSETTYGVGCIAEGK